MKNRDCKQFRYIESRQIHRTNIIEIIMANVKIVVEAHFMSPKLAQTKWSFEILCFDALLFQLVVYFYQYVVTWSILYCWYFKTMRSSSLFCIIILEAKRLYNRNRPYSTGSNRPIVEKNSYGSDFFFVEKTYSLWLWGNKNSEYIFGLVVDISWRM